MQIAESRSKQFLTRKAFTAATGCFAMMGFTSTCWGAIVPYISEKNNFSISLSGVIYGVFMFHTLVGTVLMQSLSQKIDLIWFARGGIFLTTLGFMGVLLFSSQVAVLLSAAFGGAGYGATGITFLQMITRSSNSTNLRMNIASAVTGLGALAGPFFISILGVVNIPWIILTSLSTAIVATQLIKGVNWRVEKILNFKSSRIDRRKFTGLIAVLLGIVFYSGLENSIGAWLPTLSKNSGESLEHGALLTSLFYLFFTTGRFAGIWLANHFSAQKIVLNMILLTSLPLVATIFVETTPFLVLPLAGLFLGPIFPNTSSWIAEKTPGFPMATTILMISIMGGGFIFPPAIGFIIEGASINFFALVVTPLLFLSIIFFTVGYFLWKKPKFT